MRVLHVVPYYPPDGVGGVGEVVAHLHQALLDAGHVSEVVTAGTTQGQLGVRRIARGSIGWTLRVTLQAHRARSFDVVHCHQGEALGLVLAMRTMRVNTPVLATYHVDFAGVARAHRPYRLAGTLVGRTLRNWWYRRVTATVHRISDAIMLRLADAVSFISRSAAIDVLGDVRGKNARVIHNALPPLPSDEGPPVPPTELLFVGSGSVRKRLHVLPYVLRAVRDRRPGARLRIIGPERDAVPDVVRLFRELGVEDAVEWVGRLRSDQLPSYYDAASVLVVPSAYEGLPMVILEAFRSGLPCVATMVSGHPEVVEDGVTGFLVPPDHPAAMAEACLKILTDPYDGAHMRDRARRVVRERFSIDRLVHEYLTVYTEVTS